MKRNILTLSLLFISYIFSYAQSGNFSIKSNIGGINDGTTVFLRSIEEGADRDNVIASDTVHNGQFCLTGSVDSPTLSRVEIIIKKYYEDGTPNEAETSTVLMLENADYTIEADNINDMPLVWEFQQSPLTKEANVKVIGGGVAEKEYHEYRKLLHPLELKAWTYEAQARKWMFTETVKNKDSIDFYQKLQIEAEKVAEQKKMQFIKEHPQYSISMFHIHQMLQECFSFTQNEIDEMLSWTSGTRDIKRLEQLKISAEYAKSFAKGSKYTDFEVVTENNETRSITDYIKNSQYTMIDFWASWCGPCRASIPHVKELHKKYGDKLCIISVSVDKEEKAWEKAVKEEQMPWTQLLASKTGVRRLQKSYNLTSIPYMLIIDKEGRIVCATHEPNVISSVLDTNIK
ncbi:MAG: AhpC/TSA family protein [Bacteroides sp.]|nr:AhpC/TSA family protein [Roseburia sp.]MCM1346568.1 AhpC/TSA family protein [Bacteroides sp.]MCM1420554.1 AhpC/TSA family protein [Bacteroides sp.]